MISLSYRRQWLILGLIGLVICACIGLVVLDGMILQEQERQFHAETHLGQDRAEIYAAFQKIGWTEIVPLLVLCAQDPNMRGEAVWVRHPFGFFYLNRLMCFDANNKLVEIRSIGSP